MSLPSFLRREAAPAPPARITLRRRLLGRRSRLRTAGMAAGLLGLGLASFQPAQAATYSWNGMPGDWFSSPSSWTLNGLPTAYPGAGDDAQNLTNAAMTLGQSTTVNSFLSNGAFTLNGGTFSGNKANAASTLQINNVFTLNGGQVNNFTIQAGVQQSGQPAPSVVVANNGNNSLNNTIVNANVDMTQAGGGAFLRLFNTNTVNGTISLGSLNNNDSYGLRLNDGSNLVIGSKGMLAGFGNVSQDNTATLTNNGLVNANSSGNILTLNQSIFTNTGTAEATNGGTLTVNSAVTNSGAIKAVGAGSVVNLINHTFAGTGTAASGNLLTASGGGVINVNNENLVGTINTDAATALVIGGSGGNAVNFGGSGTTINGNLDLTQAGGGAFLRLYGTDTENGTITLGSLNNNNSYGLRLNDGSNLVISGGSTLQGFGNVYQDATATLTNNGLVNANSSGNILTLNQSIFTNTGTAEATNGGTLTVNSAVTNTGAVRATTGGVVNLVNNTFTGTAASGNLFTASGGGVINVNNENLVGTINTAPATALMIGNSGGNAVNAGNGTGSTVINGNLSLTADGGGDFLRFYGTDTQNGTITLGSLNGNDSYGLRLNDGSNLVISGGSTLQGFGNVSQDNTATLTNNGLVNANSAGNTLTLNQSIFINSAGATAEATNGGTLTLNLADNGTRALTNSGAIKAVGAGSVVNLVNNTFTGSGPFTGSGAAAQGNVFTASGGGVINVNNENLVGTINTDAATALMIGNSGGNAVNFGGSGTTINGNLSLTADGGGDFLRFYGTDTINGTITLGSLNNNNSYGLRLNDGANLILSGGSTLAGFGNVYQDNVATLTSSGLVNANSSAGNTLTMAQTNFINNGTAEATGGGILSLNNNTTNGAGATIAAVGNNGSSTNNMGSVVNITGTFTGVGNNLLTASGGGVINVNSANLLGTINTTPSTALMIGNSGGNAVNNGGSGVTINGNLNVAEADQGSFLRFYGTDTVNGTITLGTVNQNNSYGLRLNDNSNLILSGGSTLQGFGNVYQDNVATLTNGGLVNANSAGNTLTMAQSNFANNGTAEATGGGILSLNNNTANSGAVKAVGAGSAVNITGTFTGSGTAAQGNLITASGGGVINVNSTNLVGTINTDAATALMIGNSGGNAVNYANGTGSTVINGNLNVAEADGGSFLRFYGTDTVNGTITLGSLNGNSSYGLRLNDNSNLVIGAAGTLQGFGVVSQDNTATLTNNGTINANVTGGNSLTFNQSNFVNNGTAQAANGAALVVNSGNATNSGTINVMPTGTATFSNGLTQTAGVTRVFGTLNASETINGGFFGGNGQVIGNIVNVGGEVQSVNNNSGGSLNISGNFSQGIGGMLDVFFANSGNTLLTVTGQTTLAGILNAQDIEAAQFTKTGVPFAFLDYSGTLAATGTSGGFTQYFSNEIPLTNNTGLIMGPNGFQFELINDTTHDMLDLEVIKAGSPVPEASTTVSFGLLLALGLGGAVVAARRKKKA